LFKIRELQDGLLSSFVFAFRHGMRPPIAVARAFTVLDFLTSSALGAISQPGGITSGFAPQQ
jgi:hypothetical protein